MSTVPGREQFEEELTPDAKSLRDCFVRQYMVDFDALAACQRLGFQSTFAVHWAQTLSNDGYVQRQIAELKRALVATPDQENADRALLENSLREAMQRGPYASRVAAGRAFAELKGWNRPDGDGTGDELMAQALREFAQRAPV